VGNWTKYEFNRDKLPERCFLFAGEQSEKRREEILSHYETIVFHKHTVYEAYIVSNGNSEELLIFQAYGASLISDLSFILKDGGVREIIFIGTAFGITGDLKVGDYVIPNEVQALEGVLKVIFEADYSYPNSESMMKIEHSFELAEERYIQGKTVSVPCTFAHPDESKYDNDVIGLEMELSSILYFSNQLGIQCAGVLVISDTKDHGLLDDRTIVDMKWVNCFKVIQSGLR
jgi:hypothetical protein